MNPSRNQFAASLVLSLAKPAAQAGAGGKRPGDCRPWRRLGSILIVPALALLGSPQATGATRTWDGSADSNWSNTANWSGDTLPSANNDTASFAGTFGVGGTAISLNGNQNTGTLSISTTTDFSLNNNTLTLGTGDITRSATSGTTTINSGITIGNDATWNIEGNLIANGIIDDAGENRTLTKSGTGTLTLNNNNTFADGLTLSAGTLVLGHDNAAGSGTLTLTAGTIQATGGTRTIANNLSLGGNLIYSGSENLIFTDGFDQSAARSYTVNNTTEFSGAITGGDSLAQSGTGTLILSGGNTLGAVTVNAGGALRVANNGALGTPTAGTVVASGGALELTGGRAIGAEALTLDGTGVGSGGALRNISGTNSWAGTITINSATRINSDLGLLTLDVASGNAITGSNDNLSFGGDGNITVADVIATGTGTLTKDGAGTLTLSGLNTYTGLTTVSNGTLAYGVTDALKSGAVTVNGGTLDIKNFSDTVGAVTMSSGSITGTTGVLTGTSYSLTNTGSVSAILGGGNMVTVTKTGAGTVYLTGANTYQGETTFTSGIVNVATLSNYGVAGSLGSRLEADEKSGGASTNVSMHFMGGTLQYTGATAQSTDRGIRVGLTGGIIDASGSIPSATMSFTKSNENVDIWDTGGARSLTLTGSNTGDNIFAINWQAYTGGSSLVKSGAGTWVLTNTHNSEPQTDAYKTFGGYGGGTTLTGGTLGFVNNAIGGGVVDFAGNATLRWQTGNTQDITTGSGAGVARSVKIEDGMTATFNTNGNNVTLSNAFAVGTNKTGALAKDGAGTLTLNAANTYTGGTTVSAGTLVVNGSLSTGAVSVSGTLAGTGTVGGATTINDGGTHAPGPVGEVGTQAFSSDLNYAAGSIFEWDLNANSTSMGFDMVGVGGASVVDVNHAVFKIVFGETVNMFDPFWNTPFVTRKWAMTSIFGKEIVGAFTSVDTGSYPVNPRGSFSIDHDYLVYSTEGAPGEALVPEPSSTLVGLLLAAGLLRRKRCV